VVYQCQVQTLMNVSEMFILVMSRNFWSYVTGFNWSLFLDFPLHSEVFLWITGTETCCKGIIVQVPEKNKRYRAEVYEEINGKEYKWEEVGMSMVEISLKSGIHMDWVTMQIMSETGQRALRVCKRAHLKAHGEEATEVSTGHEMT